MSCYFSAETEFSITGLVLPSTVHQHVIYNFSAIGSGMREYGVRRKVVGTKGDQFEVVALRFAREKANHNMCIGFEVRGCRGALIAFTIHIKLLAAALLKVPDLGQNC